MSSKLILHSHPELKGCHALFSPSQCSWTRYDEEKILDKIRGQYRTSLGTEIHEYAADEITLFHKKSNTRSISQEIESHIYQKYKDDDHREFGLKLIRHLNYIPKEVYETVKHYINDAIAYKMDVEWPLVYCDYVFGTADSIIFDEKEKLLRIHDLKTGSHEANMEQLEIYAALFCLEYAIKPSEIRMELRLYQLDGIVIHEPTVADILPHIDSILTIDKIANSVERESR